MNLYILSRNRALYSTTRLVEAAEDRGHHVRILDHLHCNLVIEKNNPHIIYHGEQIEKPTAIIPRVGSSVSFYGSSVVRQFEMMGAYTVNSSGAILRSRDKLESMQILSRSGVGLPITSFTNYSDDFEQIIESVGGTPLVIKLIEGTQGLGVLLAENNSSAESVIEAFNKLKARVIVQEFIKESKGEDIRAIIVGGKVIASMKRKGPPGEFRSNIHRGGSGTVVELTQEEERSAIEAAAALGLNVAGVDMLRSYNGPLVIEVNSSPGLEGVEEATGVDVASSIVKFIEKAHLKG
ncbi:MAG: ribosomal protein S6--L-glutamate ligase [Parvicellaceae bacterium]